MFWNRRKTMKLSEAITMVNRVVRPKKPDWYSRPVDRLIADIGDIDIRSVTPDMVTNWFNDLSRHGMSLRHPGKKLSAWTIDCYARGLKAFFNHLVRMGHLNRSPVEYRLNRLPKKAKKDISEEDLGKMVLKSKYNARDYAIVCILRDSGCRVSGLISMRITALHITRHTAEDGSVTLRGRALVNEKGDKGRYIFFGDEACRALRQYLDSRPFDAVDDVLWVNNKGVPLTRSGVGQMLKRVARYAGVTGHCNPHAFRHAFAKRLLSQNAPAKVIQELMGHEDVTTTMNMYVVLDDEELESYHRKYVK